MKKLLLTVAISGLMMGGASAVTGDISGCPSAQVIEAAIKKANNDYTKFTFEYREDIWEVEPNSIPVKKLVKASALIMGEEGFGMICHYNDGTDARLYKKNCENKMQ